MGHIETAVSMFNAGEVLHEYFRHHNEGSEDEKAQRGSTIIPLVVVHILGIEVGLKALIERQGQTPDRVHDLKDLYGQISSKIREQIGNKIAAYGVDAVAIEGLLTTHRDSLQEWRYMGDYGATVVVDLKAISATHKAIIEVHTKVYGAAIGRKERPASKGQVGVPKAIQDAATQYMKDVSSTDAEDSETHSDESPSRRA